MGVKPPNTPQFLRGRYNSFLLGLFFILIFLSLLSWRIITKFGECHSAIEPTYSVPFQELRQVVSLVRPNWLLTGPWCLIFLELGEKHAPGSLHDVPLSTRLKDLLLSIEMELVAHF
jgi:hypothetical protein